MLGGLKLLKDHFYMQDGLEKSEDDPVRLAKVILSSCSLASSVANEPARDVFERAVKVVNPKKPVQLLGV